MILTIFVVAAAGLLLGGASAWYSIQYSHRIGAINIGPWTAFPHAGIDTIDPYTVARAVAEGTVPLGSTEGLSFEAVTDSQGRALSLACDYKIEGNTPPSKIWTLVSYDAAGLLAPAAPGGRSATYSNQLLFFADGSFQIQASRTPKPGNWLAISGKGGMRLVLRLYDTPITANASSEKPAMPAILPGECAQ